MPKERLQRALARAGIGSRRASEVLIEAGRVTINDVVATLGDKVDIDHDLVEVDGHRIPLNPSLLTYALHKPSGVVTTMRDPQGRPDLRGFVPEGPRIFPVGRLDLDTEGLLLLTNDGEMANRLTHPRYGVEKEYLAEVDGRPTPRHLSRLRSGIQLDDGSAHAARATIEGSAGDRGAVRLVMTEGRKREVRRLLDAVGLPVVRLIRVRVANVQLADLSPGALRRLTTDEVRGLYEAAGL